MAPSESSRNEENKGSMSCVLITLVFFATIGGFLFGYDTGVVSGVTIFWDDDPNLSLSSVQVEQLVSITVGGAALGTATSGMPLQWYGRKPLIMVASAFYISASVILGFANGFVMLFLGRFLLGVGVGLSSIAVPVYLAEMSPPHLRGSIVSLYGFAIVVGQAVACLLNIGCDHWFSSESAKWRFSLAFAGLPAAIQLMGFLFGLPESPKWLASIGRKEEAAAVLKTLRHDPTEDQIAMDMSKLEAMPVEDIGELGTLIHEIWTTPKLRRIFRLGMGLQLLQQFSGINTIMYYGASILVMCGFPKKQSLELSFLLAVSQGVGIMLSNSLFDKYGRRAMVIPSCILSALCMYLVALAFQLGVESYQFLALLGLFGYLLFFGLGLSPGPWVINSEIYPVHVRGLGTAAATTTNWVANYGVSSSFLTLVHAMGRPGVFITLGSLGMLGAVWLFHSLPETANKTLEEIEGLFERPEDFSTIADKTFESEERNSGPIRRNRRTDEHRKSHNSASGINNPLVHEEEGEDA